MVAGRNSFKIDFAGGTRLAVRTNGTLSYLLSDHLGSSSVTTNASGVKTTSALYKAFGETRYTLGALGTDYKFTGQRLQAELGIYWFQSRWMDPSLGRFTSPDTIVPTSTQGTQAWDRYAFVNNNPVKYVDPTGHGAEIIVLGAVIIAAIVFAYDMSRRHGANEPPCSGTLSSCFEQNKLMKFSNNQVIDKNEFKGMLDTIDSDLDSKFRTSIDPARADYDTPFFNGDNRFDGDDFVTDSVVCIEDKCSKQSAVNYVAQGMYSARTGQSLEDAISLTNNWNEWWWGSQATDDELYWLEYGYTYYCQNNPDSCSENAEQQNAQ